MSRLVRRFRLLLPPSGYIALAGKAISSKYKEVFLSKDFLDPVVTRRLYRNAPKEDQDISHHCFLGRLPESIEPSHPSRQYGSKCQIHSDGIQNREHFSYYLAL